LKRGPTNDRCGVRLRVCVCVPLYACADGVLRADPQGTHRRRGPLQVRRQRHACRLRSCSTQEGALSTSPFGPCENIHTDLHTYIHTDMHEYIHRHLQVCIVAYVSASPVVSACVRRSLPEIWRLLRQILEALEYIHRKGIIHRCAYSHTHTPLYTLYTYTRPELHSFTHAVRSAPLQHTQPGSGHGHCPLTRHAPRCPVYRAAPQGPQAGQHLPRPRRWGCSVGSRLSDSTGRSLSYILIVIDRGRSRL
jgi:hypothetical protein